MNKLIRDLLVCFFNVDHCGICKFWERINCYNGWCKKNIIIFCDTEGLGIRYENDKCKKYE